MEPIVRHWKEKASKHLVRKGNDHGTQNKGLGAAVYEQRVDDGASLYMDAVQSLKEEHRSIYTAMHKKAPINLGYEENDALE